MTVIAVVALLWVVKWPAALFQAGSHRDADVSLEVNANEVSGSLTVRGRVGGDDVDLTATSSESRVAGSIGSHDVDARYTRDASGSAASGSVDGRTVSIDLAAVGEQPVVVKSSLGDVVFDWEERRDEAASATVVTVNGTFDEEPLTLRYVGTDSADDGPASVSGSARGEPVSLEITALDNGVHFSGACFDATRIDVDLVSRDNEAGGASLFIDGRISGDRALVGAALVGVAFLWSGNL